MYILYYNHLGVLHEAKTEEYQEIMEMTFHVLNEGLEVLKITKNEKVVHNEMYLMKKFNKRYY